MFVTNINRWICWTLLLIGTGLTIFCVIQETTTFWSFIALLSTITVVFLMKKQRDIERKKGIHNENILKQKTSLLTIISNASLAIVKNTPLSETLELILQQTITLFSAQNGSIMLINENEEMTIKAAIGLDEEIIKNTKVKLGERISGWVAKNNEPLLLINQVFDSRFQSVKERWIKDALIVPLRVNGIVIGVLSISNKVGEDIFNHRDLDSISIIAEEVSIAIENARLYNNLESMSVGTLKSLCQTIDARDTYTKEHSDIVSNLSLLIAKAMKLSEKEIELIKFASLLHDIGKVGIRESILVKPGKLSSDEYAEIKRHPFISMQILKPLHFLRSVIPLVYHHHERYDGAGYLDGLFGESIPLGARIISVADAFEAMTANRPYRIAKPIPEALNILKEEAGKQFDPEVVEVFLDVYSRIEYQSA